MHHLLCVFLQDFQFDDWDELCDKLNALATDCNKHRAKTDKRKQRSVFRDVLKAVEVGHVDPVGIVSAFKVDFHPPSLSSQEGDFQSETIRFGTERMTIDSWVRKRTYDAFREFVGSGMNYHLQVKSCLKFTETDAILASRCLKSCFIVACLQGNEFIRDVFELGPPILVDSATMKAMKISRFERVRMNCDRLRR